MCAREFWRIFSSKKKKKFRNVQQQQLLVKVVQMQFVCIKKKKKMRNFSFQKLVIYSATKIGLFNYQTDNFIYSKFCLITHKSTWILPSLSNEFIIVYDILLRHPEPTKKNKNCSNQYIPFWILIETV